ncbi:Gti1/Pac2 family-domain-containing protein [Mycena floridula]|nr:Gti1/Pac2 family-domain-containing protein [Mycena floridula]
MISHCKSPSPPHKQPSITHPDLLSNILKLPVALMASSPDVPPFHGYVETTVHALRLIHSARQGVIPRITRRLNDTERRSMIKSGAVFVFSVEESGIKRWTDGLLWSPSRIVGNFLVYREINERATSRGNHKKSYTSDDASRALHRTSPPSQLPPAYKPSSSDQGTFKVNGLIKKTITVTIDGSDLHLISYYTSEDIRAGRLKKPSSRPDIMSLYMPPHIFRLTNFRVPPKIEIGPDGKPRLVAEAEDLETVECKVEEQSSYSPSGSPTSIGQSSPIEGPYSGSSLYPVSHMNHASLNYMRSGTGERWNSAETNMRLSSPVRPSTAMSSSPTATYMGGGRRDWSSNDSASYDSGVYVDHRSRVRSNPYQSPMSPRENSGDSRYPGVGRNREIGVNRTPWLLNQEPVESKEGIRTGNPTSRSSYPGSSSIPHYTMDGYHTNYSSSNSSGGWSSSNQNSFSSPSSQSSFSAGYEHGGYSDAGKMDNFTSPGDNDFTDA